MLSDHSMCYSTVQDRYVWNRRSAHLFLFHTSSLPPLHFFYLFLSPPFLSFPHSFSLSLCLSIYLSLSLLSYTLSVSMSYTLCIFSSASLYFFYCPSLSGFLLLVILFRWNYILTIRA